MPATIDKPGLLTHYKRLLATGERSQDLGKRRSVIDSNQAELSHSHIQDRLGSTKDALYRIIDKYLDGDRSLRGVVDDIIRQGGEGLRILADNDETALEERPEALEGLEVIVRVDGSRPTFLIREGEVDLDSSPIGGWRARLDESATALHAAIPSVGRIDIPGGGFGTGFLVQDDLVVTNRHVLQAMAREDDRGRWRLVPGVVIDFGHEYRGRESRDRRAVKSVVFAGASPIDPNHIDHAKLDLALIELESGANPSSPRQVFSLDVSPSWAQPEAELFTIGYPGPPNSSLYPPTLLEQLFRRLYGYKRLAPGRIIASQPAVASWTLSHDATTLGGNSGSIVVRAGSEGLAAGLHYGGRTAEPRSNWAHVLEQVLDATDGRSAKTLRSTLSERGVRLSEPAPWSPQTNGHQSGPCVRSQGPGSMAVGSVANNTIRPEVHGTAANPEANWRYGITLQSMKPLGGLKHGPLAESGEAEAAGDGTTSADSFAGRGGYDPEALPGWRIALPMPGGDMRELRRGGNGVELKYEHFSVIMSASRRMAMLTACNINGAESRRLPRANRWNFDGRLDKEDQWGNDLYRGNNVDRGHMVRREDPVWGQPNTAKRANIDTFHYTNSCPQMAGVNQVTWLGLENYILDHTREDNMWVSVFTGPYFTDDDLAYRGALIPKAYWKIVAFLNDDGRPSATAYEVSQATELQQLEFVFAGYKTFQISIQKVMNATNIDFSALLPFDGFSQYERIHGNTIAERIDDLSQIRV